MIARLAGAILGLSLLFAPVRAGSAERVVSLNLCTDQWLVLLAPEKVAALSTLARDPSLSFVAKQAAGLPVVHASAEAVLALHPDLVLGARFGARTTLALLERLGTRVERIDQPTDFPGIRAGLRATAALLGVGPRAETLIAAMDAALPGPGRAMRALVWEPRGWTSGSGGLMDAILHQAGLIDIGTGGRVGLEALVRARPDLLVLSGDSAGPSLATAILSYPALDGIPVTTIPASLTICPIPSTADAVAMLVK